MSLPLSGLKLEVRSRQAGRHGAAVDEDTAREDAARDHGEVGVAEQRRKARTAIFSLANPSVRGSSQRV
jgi:hypothetical protein